MLWVVLNVGEVTIRKPRIEVHEQFAWVKKGDGVLRSWTFRHSILQGWPGCLTRRVWKSIHQLRNSFFALRVTLYWAVDGECSMWDDFVSPYLGMISRLRMSWNSWDDWFIHGLCQSCHRSRSSLLRHQQRLVVILRNGYSFVIQFAFPLGYLLMMLWMKRHPWSL